MKYAIATIIIVGIIGISFLTQAAPSSASPIVSVEPSCLKVSLGENFTVNITVDPEGNEIFGVDCLLYFNKDLLNATSLTPGTFFSGFDTTTYGEGINNTEGKIDYGEAITGGEGVTESGTLITLTFEAIKPGVSNLNFSEVTVVDTGITDVTINNGTIEIGAPNPPKSFLIYGHIFYENSTPCNNSLINIKNLNTSDKWNGETKENYNYYQLMLISGIDIIADQILQFNVTSPDGSQSNTTTHEVILEEIKNGGIFNFNITLKTLAIHDINVSTDYEGAINGIKIIKNATVIPAGQNLIIGEEYTIGSRIVNEGNFNENVNVTIKVRNETGTVFQENFQKSINVGSYKDAWRTWDTTELTPGNYNITVNATIPDDAHPGDNERTREIILESPIAPHITSFAPTDTTPTDDEGSARKFNITINQAVNVSWQINGTQVQFNNTGGVTEASYTNTSAVAGYWNVTAYVYNPNGSDIHTWWWTVKSAMPDLVITEKFEWASQPDLAYNITYTVKNIGNANANASMTSIGIEGEEKATDSVPELAPGASHTATFGPFTMSGTNDTIKVCADKNDEVDESNESNNCLENEWTIALRVDIGDYVIPPGSSVQAPITIYGIQKYGAGTICIEYNPLVVEVTSIDSSSCSTVISYNIDNSLGTACISAWNTTGVSGDIVFAYVTLEAVGSDGSSTSLNLTVSTLEDTYYNDIPTYTVKGSLTIREDISPLVGNPIATPRTILNDNGRARVPGTNVSQLNVSVADASGVRSVTINLSPILGPSHDSVPMNLIEGDNKSGIWSVTTNADYDPGVDKTYCLRVNATDVFGNSNTAKCVLLTVLRRGDIVRDNKIDIKDAYYIARYTVGLEPEPDEFIAGVVPADGYDGVDMSDALYIARYTVGLECPP